MSPTYYTLLIRDDVHSPWGVHFGAWFRDDVYDERQDLIDGGTKSSLIKIIMTDDAQDQINEAVTHLNAPSHKEPDTMNTTASTTCNTTASTTCNTTVTPPRVRSARVIFTTAVIEALRFTDTGDDGQPATDAPMHPEDHAKLTDDCAKFWEQIGTLVREEFHAARRLTQSPKADFTNWADAIRSAGHDYWYTRNGHGAGFWDGDWTLHGDALTAASEAAGSLGVYEGDDGSLCIDGLPAQRSI